MSIGEFYGSDYDYGTVTTTEGKGTCYHILAVNFKICHAQHPDDPTSWWIHGGLDEPPATSQYISTFYEMLHSSLPTISKKCHCFLPTYTVPILGETRITTLLNLLPSITVKQSKKEKNCKIVYGYEWVEACKPCPKYTTTGGGRCKCSCYKRFTPTGNSHDGYVDSNGAPITGHFSHATMDEAADLIVERERSLPCDCRNYTPPLRWGGQTGKV
jgi:hypothetical protein